LPDEWQRDADRRWKSSGRRIKSRFVRGLDPAFRGGDRYYNVKFRVTGSSMTKKESAPKPLSQIKNRTSVKEEFIKRYNISEKLFDILKKDMMARRLWAFRKITGARFKGTEKEFLEEIQKNKQILELIRAFDTRRR
jgi:hypothetical protein